MSNTGKNSTYKDTIECVHNYTSTYARKQGYSWTKITGMNMCQISRNKPRRQGNRIVDPTSTVQTDRTISNNKPDIMIHDNEKGTCMLIDVVISGDRNVIKKEAEKIVKHKDLTIEIQRMWNVNTKVIPVIIGATGTVSMSFRKYVRKITENYEVKELQKTAILGTAHILRKVLT